MPLGRQIASVSAKMRAIKPGDMAAAVVTLTMMGGIEEGEAAGAANAVNANSAATTLVAVSIMSAIDGCNSQKFDVRYRQERTIVSLEIATNAQR